MSNEPPLWNDWHVLAANALGDMKKEKDPEAMDMYLHLMNLTTPISPEIERLFETSTPFIERWKTRMVAIKLGAE